eukprot:5349879-Pyramimonas_sp.AAC.1
MLFSLCQGAKSSNYHLVQFLIDKEARRRATDAVGRRVIGCSVDSHFCHLAWTNLPRKEGGLGGCNIPLVSDITKAISKDYEVLIEEGDAAGVSLRWVETICLRILHYNIASQHGELYV